ncbi:hypothetical protein HPB49_009260 [Dermacentor silvarum]|uniref:Uncharacterized protein n=1 Tax=Dermacentor silvarum TaxID=543639 RepID=A0ACB8DCE9_DERSI|nr:hypothetical protein HPB49_009260 [Dermacentor silvarum]
MHLGRRRGRREAEDAFDMPDDLFRQHFRLRKGTLRWLCDEVAEELGGVRSTALSVERQLSGVCWERGDDCVTQPAVTKCVRRVAEAIVHTGTRNKLVQFPRTAEQKAAVKEGFLRRGGLPGVIGCVDGSLITIIAPMGDKAACMCRKGFYALNSMFICDADMRILAVNALRPGSDHDAYVWRTTWLRRRFQDGHIVKAGKHLLVERCIGLLNSRFRCLQKYHALHYEPDRAANIIAAGVVLHNLCRDEGDSAFDEVDDDDSSNSSSDDANGGPLPQRVPRAKAARIMYMKECAARDNVIRLCGTTRQQHQHYLRRVRRRLRRQQHRQQQ